MSVIVSQGISPYKVSAGGTDSGDVVVSGGSMFVLSAGVRKRDVSPGGSPAWHRARPSAPRSTAPGL